MLQHIAEYAGQERQYFWGAVLLVLMGIGVVTIVVWRRRELGSFGIWFGLLMVALLLASAALALIGAEITYNERQQTNALASCVIVPDRRVADLTV